MKSAIHKSTSYGTFQNNSEDAEFEVFALELLEEGRNQTNGIININFESRWNNS